MIKFGTGGWRAIIGDDFIKSNIKLVALGIVRLVKKSKHDKLPIIIGYDRRFLSRDAMMWIAEVLANNKIKVICTNRSVPTPLVMHYVKKHNLYYGIEITASHNPAKYNGIKLIIEEGRDASVEVTDELEKEILLIENKEEIKLDFDELCEKGMISVIKNPFNEFLDDIIKQINMKAIHDYSPRILFDSMHGSGKYALETVLISARCTVDTINDNRDAYFGGFNPAPSKERLNKLINGVVDKHYDLGIAIDGDGDRLGIVDYNGRYINANEILCLLYYYLVKYKGWKGPVVRNLSTTHMLDKIAESFGEKCYEVPVGFKWISSKIDEVDAVLGGEASGGLTVRGHIHGKDSTYAAALFVEMISVIGKSPSKILDELQDKYGKFSLYEEAISFKPENKKKLSDKIFVDKIIPDFGIPITNIGYKDGCKFYFENGDFLVCRFSGTEPLLRFASESSTEEKAQKYIKIFRDTIGL